MDVHMCAVKRNTDRQTRRAVTRGSARSARVKAGRELGEILDSKLFKALCETVRVDIVKFLTVEGRANVSAISDAFPQDSSVISRHLAILHEAGVLRRDKQGRHVYFELDGVSVVDQMEKILERCKNTLPLCCGGSG